MYTYKSIAKPYDPFCVPLLVNLKNDQLLLVTDVNINHFPGLWMKGNMGKFVSIFPAYPKRVFLKGNRSMQVPEREDYIAKVPGKYQFPWRVLMVTNGKGLLESNTLYSLAEPNRIGETSWIKPGKVSWDWWNNYTISNVPFEPGVNQATYQHYIDFAAENGLPYILLDEGWSNSKPEQFLEVVPSLNMPELSAYAQSKGVRLILWTTSTSLEMNFNKAFETFTKWGIAGIKVDFMQRDDQVMNELCYSIAEEAAKRKILVDFHGGSKPTGLQRTYPNVLSHESVRGMEQSLWNTKANPDMAIMNAFIRMSVGPMDYTPGAMINMTKDNFVPGKATGYKQMGSLGTRCQQLAMYVVYTSPIQMLCDSPTRYRNNSGSLDFLREVPTVWDETIALHADPCQSIAIAKRSGDRWFVGCMTNSQGRELELNFSFLPKGKNYVMKSWADGINANVDAQDNIVSEKVVNASTKIKVTMANGGGFAGIIMLKGSSVNEINLLVK
jgi:alpha-glucosidase